MLVFAKQGELLGLGLLLQLLLSRTRQLVQDGLVILDFADYGYEACSEGS